MVMDRGIRVWELWRERNLKTVSNFPLIEEIITMPECQGFYMLFSKTSEEYNGLVVDSEWIENPQGPLSRLIIELVTEKSQKKAACALIVLPHHTAVALLRHGTVIYLFDPHGNKSLGNEIELTQFNDYRQVVPYLLNKYALDNIDDRVQYRGVRYSELELANDYGYAANVFTLK